MLDWERDIFSMIPLRIRATCPAGLSESFVVRLCEPGNIGAISDREVHPLSVGGCGFETKYGLVQFPNISKYHILNDVLLVVPQKQLAHRLIRAGSAHNTFLVTEQCDQLCIMCSQPPKKHHSDLFTAFTQAALLAPKNAVLGISGGEPTLYKQQLFELVEKTHRDRPDIRFHILTNAQHFSEDDIIPLREDWSRNILWGIPVYSDEAETHDYIVGKEGAFERLKTSLSYLLQTPAQLEIRTVLMRSNVNSLPSLASFISTHIHQAHVWAIMQLEGIGFARKNWSSIFFDHSDNFEGISQAMTIAMTKGIPVQLYNFPLCTIPTEFRDYAIPSISDWKNKFLEECDNCSIKNCCGGFFQWYTPDTGFSGVHAQ